MNLYITSYNDLRYTDNKFSAVSLSFGLHAFNLEYYAIFDEETSSYKIEHDFNVVS